MTRLPIVVRPQFRRFHMVRLYWRCLRYVWKHRNRPPDELIVEWVLAEMRRPYAEGPTRERP